MSVTLITSSRPVPPDAAVIRERDQLNGSGICRTPPFNQRQERPTY
ncbi:MAG: hypothetical protein VKI42_04030 [Synechococcaceae cyanobacterium]|nr:hypothetical protein [Synechococcaceae cyanobacterium]